MTSSTRYLKKVSRIRGFSMVEMIGVLAIIAILAVIIVPKVFSTIASSRITHTVASVNSMKTAVAEFAGKYGSVPVTSTVPGARLDDLLVTTGLLEQRLMVKIGTQPTNPPLAGATWTRNAAGVWIPAGGTSQATQSKVICLTSNAAAPASGNNYYLDGTTGLPANSKVISAHITGITAAEARELSLRIDGDVFSETATGTADTRGKVVYPASGASAYIYLAHQ